MASNSKMEIEKFNEKIFELWKLKMEYLLVDRDQWITVDPGTAPTRTSADDWKKTDRKEKSTIRLCLSDSVLLNVSEEATAKDLWEKLGKLLLSPFLCFHKPSFFLFICHFSFTLSHISHRIAHPRYICHLLTSELNFLIFCIKIGNLAEIAGFRQIP
jgi:hypothetical protein